MVNINNLTGLGMAPFLASEVSAQADALAFNLLQSGVSATGTTIGTALALYADICLVKSSHASTNDGVQLRTPTTNKRTQVVINASAIGGAGASTLKVYPPTGGRINSGTVNTAFSVPAGSTGAQTFYAISDLDYYKQDQ
jgi:hypothetical protein